MIYMVTYFLHEECNNSCCIVQKKNSHREMETYRPSYALITVDTVPLCSFEYFQNLQSSLEVMSRGLHSVVL